MPIYKAGDRLEEYRLRADFKNPDDLSGRPFRSDLTRYVNENIFNTLELPDACVVADIGCGDGTLLRLCDNGRRRCFGVLPSDEELSVVGEALAATECMTLLKGTASSIPLADNSVDAVVCNGVLPLLQRQEVPVALSQLHRIARPGALVFVGEVPAWNEMEGRNYGDSIITWLCWTLKNQGKKALLNRLREVLIALLTSKRMIIAPKEHFFCDPGELTRLAETTGLVLVSHRKHQAITTDNRVTQTSRYDYIFRKR